MKALEGMEGWLNRYIATRLTKNEREIKHEEDAYQALLAANLPPVTVAQLRKVLPPEFVISIESNCGTPMDVEENRIMKNTLNSYEITELRTSGKNVVFLRVRPPAIQINHK